MPHEGTDIISTDPKGIDIRRVTNWIEEAVPHVTPPFRFERIAGGHSNLTYRVIDDTGAVIVLRRPPLGELLPTAHDMHREFRIISALHDGPVPVPAPFAFCDDADVTGAHFYVMAFVPGHVLHDASVAEAAFGPAQRRACGTSFIDVLASLHAVDPVEAGIGDLGRREGYIARQLKRWYGQWESSKTRELRDVDETHDILASRIPEQGPARIVHGDYRIGNCISAPDGHIAAVLDWEIATLGDPLADLGYVLSQWTEPGEIQHGHASAPSSVPGFPSRAEVIERYAARSGRDMAAIDFYIAFSHWKSACIVEGVYARYLAGALDTTGVDLEALRTSVERSASLAATAITRLR